MNVTRKELPQSRIELSIKIDKDEMITYLAQTTKKIGKEITVPGFRKGEAPKELIEKHVGPATLFAESVEHAVNESYKKAIIDEDITPLAQAAVELGEKQDETGVEFTATVDVMPQFELPDYKGIAKKVQKEVAEVTDEEVEEAKTYLLKSRGAQKEVAKKAEQGDTVVVEYVLTVDGEEKDRSEEMPVEIGGGRFIPGFEEEVVGLSAGDTKTFGVPFPDEYHSTDLAGKTGTFAITVKRVEQMELPEWNDAFINDLTGGKTPTVAEMETTIREGLAKEKAQEAETQQKQEIMDAIMAEISVELPKVLVDSEKDRLIQEMEQRAAYSGDSFEAALERAGKTREDFLNESTLQAESRVLLMLCLRKIADAEELRPDSGQVSTQMMSILSQYPKEQIEQIDQDRLRLMVEGEMLDKMALDLLATFAE